MKTKLILNPVENKNGQKILLDLIDCPAEIKKTNIGNFQINYVKAGSGPDILLLHGANLGWGQWYPNIGDLAKHFSVYALDLPGAGHSTKIDFSSCNPEKDFMDTVERFIQCMGLQKVSIVGHSLGGWIALKLAIAQKPFVNKIILVSPVGLVDYIPNLYRLFSLHPLTYLFTKIFLQSTPRGIKRFLAGPMVNKSGFKKELVDYICEFLKDQNHPLWLLRRLSLLLKKDLLLTNQLKNVLRPTLVILGDRDPLIPLKKVKGVLGLFPNASMETFSDTGHVPSLEKSEKFNKMVIEFLK